MSGDSINDVMSQAVPALLTQVPMLETTVAGHTARNMKPAGGLQADGVDRTSRVVFRDTRDVLRRPSSYIPALPRNS
jgi:hypothetical protein